MPRDSAIYDGGKRRSSLRCGCLLILLLSISRVSVSQDFQIYVDGKPQALDPPAQGADPKDVVQSMLESLYRQGFHFAVMDSMRSDSSGTRTYLSRRDTVFVHSIHVRSSSLQDEDRYLTQLGLGSKDPLDIGRLEGGIDRILSHLSDLGRHMAQVRLDSLVARNRTRTQYDVFLSVKEGPLVPITHLVLEGARRTSSTFASRMSQLGLGRPMPASVLPEIGPRLLDSGIFSNVGEAEIRVYRDSTASINVAVEEAPPGSFDLVLGYLPSGGSSGSGQLVGSGHLNLLNPFGLGRTFGLRLERRPAQVSNVDVRLGDPQVAGLPVRFEGGFSGIQQDSTYNRRRWIAELGYRLLRGIELSGTFSSETTAPGSAGLKILGKEQRIPRSESVFWGVKVRVRRVDNPFNPTSGFLLESTLETGNKNEATRVVASTDTTRLRRSFRQERLTLEVRGFIPTFPQQVLVIGTNAHVLLSDSFEESDLFRIGGAQSLRGYDEDQFRASTAIRLLMEYRLLLESRSYVFIFADAGYIETPGLGSLPSKNAWHPGYGAGMQFETAAGVITASYALNNKDGVTNGRVHLGISFGL